MEQTAKAGIPRMKELIGILRRADTAYYKYDAPIMTDREYDALYDELAMLEDASGIVISGSPTQKVSGEILEGLAEVEHTRPMLSAAKTKSVDEIIRFIGGHAALVSWKLDGLILTHHPMQSYYAGKYNGGNARPECSSRDGNVGVGSPGGNCARCYLNQFGTAENNSKACKRKHRIYILREGEIFPIILDLPTLSVDGFGRYLRRLLTVGKDPNAIVTRFALKKAINKAGITYSQVTFTEGRDLLPEERTAVRRLAAQVQAYSSSGDFDADDADAANVDAIPDYDPETGEILSSDPQGF